MALKYNVNDPLPSLTDFLTATRGDVHDGSVERVFAFQMIRASWQQRQQLRRRRPRRRRCQLIHVTFGRAAGGAIAMLIHCRELGVLIGWLRRFFQGWDNYPLM